MSVVPDHVCGGEQARHHEPGGLHAPHSGIVKHIADVASYGIARRKLSVIAFPEPGFAEADAQAVQ